MADKSLWDIASELYQGFGNNPRNTEAFDAMANMNPFLAAYRGGKTLKNVDPKVLAKALKNEAYGISNDSDNRAAGKQLANIGMGVLDIAPMAGALKPAIKPTAKALGKALAMTENMPVGMSITDVSRPLTDFEKAHKLAQQRAALPVSEGGLGLPATNTAMDRAKAMGFDTEKQWLHGTRNDFGEFSKTKDIGFHFGDKWQANDRAGSGNTSNVIPVYLKNNNIINTDDVYGAGSTFPIYGNLRDKGHITQEEIDNIFQNVIRANHDKALNNLLKSKNYGGIEYDNMVEGIPTNLRRNGEKNTARIVLDQSQIRSPNAAFDPFRRNESSILAGVAAAPVGLLAVDKEKTKKKRSNK